MYLFAALIIASLSCFVDANPTPRAGVAIPITRHTQVRDPNGVVDLAKLRRSVRSADAWAFCTISRHRITSNDRCVSRKLHHGYRAYEQNTGARHPSLPKVELLKRNNGSEPLVDYDSDYWYGSISVGTPPKPFKGELSFLTFYHLERLNVAQCSSTPGAATCFFSALLVMNLAKGMNDIIPREALLRKISGICLPWNTYVATSMALET